MRQFFNYEGGIWKVLGRVGDLFMLNVIFLICCIPIVTIGASLTALYAMTKKMAKNEDGYLIRGFFEQFKENFKKSTIMWLIYLGASIIPILDLIACNLMEPSFFVTFCRTVMIFTLIIINMTFLYAIALQSTFENTIKNTLKNALLMSIGHFPFSVVILIVSLSPAIAVFFLTQYLGVELLLMFALWFALAAFINSFMFNSIFKKYIDRAQEEVHEEAKEQVQEEVQA